MADTTLMTLTGRQITLDEPAVDALKKEIRGEVLTAGAPGYDTARTIWNAMIDRRPAIIVRCAGTADVLESVRFAAKHDALVSVRGGGHNIAGNAVCDGGFMIDLSPMGSVRVHPGTRRADVGPGATLGVFDHEAQALGLATPLGINSTTGVAGLTLGGGFGWLSRKYGMTVDNLVSADVVTADARLVRASTSENPELFWGIRGGGGNFGIVTNFEFQLHPFGPDVLAGLIVFPLDQAGAILRKYRDMAATMPDELNVWAVLRKAPPLPFLPASVHGSDILAIAIFFAGDPARDDEVLKPLRGLGKAHGEHVGRVPYKAWQQAFDPLLTPGARNYWKSHNFIGLSDGVLDTLVEYAGKLPSPHCEIFVGLLGGQMSRPRPDETAYSNRDAQFVMNVHGRWEKAQDDTRCISWARDFFQASAPHASGSVYVNFMTQEETDRIQAAYRPEVWKRLVRLKATWDPKNLFRMNQNITPSAGK